jgi:hypothetical protein
MKRINIRRFSLLTSTVISVIGLAAVPVSALATTKTDASASTSTAANQARLQLIITRGDNEIARRLTTLNTLTSKINGAAKLSASDKSTLSSEVSSEISGLTSLKTQLDADTTVTAAKTDAQTIITGYRVYALIVPKVELVKVADDQQVTEGKLTALATKLQSRITAEQSAGKSVTTLQSDLTDLNKQVSAAATLSTTIESSVINLQPTDYDSNHSVLSGDHSQLKTAQTEIQAAITDAKNIISGLTSA